MASDRTRQKKAQKRDSKRSVAREKHARSPGRPALDGARLARLAADLPQGTFYVAGDFRADAGPPPLLSVVALRPRPDGDVLIGTALLDRGGHGVKDGLLALVPPVAVGQLLERLRTVHGVVEEVPAPTALSLVHDAIEGANALGFSAHPDFPAVMFGPRPRALEETPRGRPPRALAIPRPDDDRDLIELLSAHGGKGVVEVEISAETHAALVAGAVERQRSPVLGRALARRPRPRGVVAERIGKARPLALVCSIMRRIAAPALLVPFLLGATVRAAPPRTIERHDGLTIMTPTPTQPNSPGLRLRSMVRPADRLWIGPSIPPFIAPLIGRLGLDLLDPRPDGGWVATYREPTEHCGPGAGDTSCRVLVKTFDSTGKEEWSVALEEVFAGRKHLEVQDVRYVREGGTETIYFNEACQSYSRNAKGACSALVAYDPVAKHVRWRTAPLASNNTFVVVGAYVVTAYGFTAEKASISVVRRSDGKVMDHHPLPSTNFEMAVAGETLSVDMYHRVGRGTFRLRGFQGAAPKLVPLGVTPPDPQEPPKPYDPPLTTAPRAAAQAGSRP